ncbi:MAG: hypothetical protein QOG80_1496 [Pseudonocardiales bacterium]|jgi:hypothetical protein|nr:hypothetical protein [Pseudonocardiales bacterium]
MTSTSPVIARTASDDQMSSRLPGRRTATATGIGPLRRLPLRDAQPPFDDELPVRTSAGRLSAQTALALAFVLPGGLPVVPDVPAAIAEPGDLDIRRLRLVPPIGEPESPRATVRRRANRDLTDEQFGPQRTSRAMLPEPRPWAGRLVQAVVEVTAGVRPLTQLVRWTTSEVYESMQLRASHAHASVRVGELDRWAEVVRSVHVSEPVDGVAEVCAIVQQGPRCRAIALRLEGIDGRWQCTALHIG